MDVVQTPQIEAVLPDNSPIHERIEGVEVVWQIPVNPRALLLIAHSGCGSPTDFWLPHPHCNLCKGLPEHTKVVKSAISRGYAVLGIKSTKDYWQTWPVEVSQDAFNVQLIIESWRSRQKLEMLPVAALGFASGASFLSALALQVEFAAVVLMISHGVSRAFQRATNRYPPTLFVHMPKDSSTAAKIQREVRDNLPLISHQASSKLYAGLIMHGIVNLQGFVTSSLHSAEIDELLNRADISETGDDRRETLVESINSLIRVAEARHAVTSRKCSEIFDWLEQHIIRRHL